MAQPRREGGGPDSERTADRAEMEAALDELEVRFLLDPDTTFETDPPPTG